jgi:hypothetical protein
MSDQVECCLLDVLRAADAPLADWNYWARVLREIGFPVRAAGVVGRVELLTSHGAIEHLLFAYAKPSHRRRVAFLQLRKAEKEARQ